MSLSKVYAPAFAAALLAFVASGGIGASETVIRAEKQTKAPHVVRVHPMAAHIARHSHGLSSRHFRLHIEG